MKNRILKYRDDLTYPQWMQTYKEDIESLFASFRDDPEFPSIDESTNFHIWTIQMYLETVHASNLVAQGEAEGFWDEEPPPAGEQLF